jgi:hypothetical protein
MESEAQDEDSVTSHSAHRRRPASIAERRAAQQAASSNLPASSKQQKTQQRANPNEEEREEENDLTCGCVGENRESVGRFKNAQKNKQDCGDIFGQEPPSGPSQHKATTKH